MTGKSDGPRRGAGEVLVLLRRHYFWIHMSVQSVCAACFLAGSVLTLFETTKAAAPWIYLFGSLTFAALPAIRLLNRRAKSVRSSPKED
ncbi:YrhK family protein [Sabulicella glaciei]|uniref:YrhK family protein n=1 Tax=Sabulicella glaciei TaxID=2984948 RepID=UPI0034A03E87